jgi:hypothetical protein
LGTERSTQDLLGALVANRETHVMRHRLSRRTAVAAISLTIAAGSVFAVAASSGVTHAIDLARGHQTQVTRPAKR